MAVEFVLRMNIYIDESGIFRRPADKENIASCVGALAIPSTQKKDIFRAFERLSFRWPKEKGEVKGKLLGEHQIAAFISMLKKYEVIYELTAIDLGIHSEDDVSTFKQMTAKNFVNGLTKEHDPELVRMIQDVKMNFEKISNQLFIQAMAMFHLIPRILNNMVLYYARRIPKELQWFYWNVDAKDQKKTQFEAAWSTIIFPILEYQTAQNPKVLAEGGDYSYWRKFEETGTPFISRVEKEKGLEPGTLSSIKLYEVLGQNFAFKDSRYDFGLQMVDILTNATQRALNGKLEISGWREIGDLMILQKGGSIQFIQITTKRREDERFRTNSSPFYYVTEFFKKRAKSLWLDPETEARLIKKFPSGGL